MVLQLGWFNAPTTVVNPHWQNISTITYRFRQQSHILPPTPLGPHFMSINARIAAVSYEGSLFGWNVVSDTETSKLQLSMIFGFNCCQSTLKSVAISSSGRYLVCGGTDERIRIYDATQNRSVGELSNPENGGISCLCFYGDSYLFSGSEVILFHLSSSDLSLVACISPGK